MPVFPNEAVNPRAGREPAMFLRHEIWRPTAALVTALLAKAVVDLIFRPLGGIGHTELAENLKDFLVPLGRIVQDWSAP